MKLNLKFILLLILGILQFNNSFSQKGLFLLGGIQYSGATYKYRFQQDGKILQRNYHLDKCWQFSLNATLHCQFARHFAIEAGLQLTEIDLSVNDQSFIKRNNITHNTSYRTAHGNWLVDDGNLDTKKWYLSPYLSAYYYFKNISTDFRPYLSGGISLNYLTSPNQKDISFQYDPTNENLQLKIKYLSNYTNSFLEAGMCYDKCSQKSPHIFIGLKYCFAGNIISGDYKDVQNGGVLYTDHVTASGNYLAFVLRIGGALSRKKEKMVSMEISKKTEVKVAINDTIKKVNNVNDSIPKIMENRKLQVAKVINVNSTHIVIKIWDHESIDGDKLSMNLNGRWIAENYLLQKEQKIMVEELNNGINYLVLHAISLGRFSPCTCAILISDGVSNQMIVLNSDLENSQSIQINVTP